MASTEPAPRNPKQTLVAALAVMAAAGGPALARCLGRASRLARDNAELRRLARTDPLTGLYNRRHLTERLVAAVSAARRHDEPVAVLFIDVDAFKRVNDQLGYEAGDAVLRAVSDRLRAAVRAEDVVGRWGGEEFLAVLPATGVDGALAAGERIRSSIAAERLVVAGREPHVTVSIGCVSGAGDAEELIREAGHALRRAKLAGRNRVVAAGGYEPDPEGS